MAVTTSEYEVDVAKFTKTLNEPAVKAIVDYCGIALRNRDSATVSSTDPEELARIRAGFAAKKLGLEPETADIAIKAVAEQMKGIHNKHRVTFYYLLAEKTGTLEKLIGK